MVLEGKPAIFLSCSEEHKGQVAYPLRDALVKHGLRVIIVSDEPRLPRTGWEPDAKVASYLEASDAVVALCTPDSRVAESELQPRLNIIDEIQRAQSLPHLVNKTMVLKVAGVRLPSNINPTYDSLDMAAPTASVGVIVRQLQQWDVVATGRPSISELWHDSTENAMRELSEGFTIGDPRTVARVFETMVAQAKSVQRRIVQELIDKIARSPELNSSDELQVDAGLLEAFINIDPGLIETENLERLSTGADFSVRGVAANLLWNLAEIAPASVPLDMVARLARPDEDWYVYSPAMAAAKQSLLTRPEATVIFERLVRGDTKSRFSAANALVDVCRVDPRVVSVDLAKRLAGDEDDLVAAKGRELLDLVGGRVESSSAHPARKFWLGLGQ